MSLDLTSIDSQFNFNMRELSGHKTYEFEDFRLDADHLLLFRGAEQLKLTPKVIETLKALVEREGEVLSKDELMDIVWPDSIVEESNLSQNLYLLRKTLGNAGDGKPFIETLRRRGYRFSADVNIVKGHFKVAEPARSIEPAKTIKIERSENIYSVVDWQRESEAEIPDAMPEIAVSSTLSDPAKVAVPVHVVEARPTWTRWKIAALSAGILVVILFGGLLTLSMNTASASGWFKQKTPLSLHRELTFTHITNGIDVNDATISPDGKYFVYHEMDGETQRLWLQQSGQSTRVELVPPSKRIFVSKTFSPDGQSIYFVSIDRETEIRSLFKIPTLGGVPTKITDDTIDSTVAVSPDGAEIAFNRISKDNISSIIVANSDGSGEKTLVLGKTSSVIWGGLAWSPDGQKIAYGEVDRNLPAEPGICTILAVDPRDGQTSRLSPDGWDACGRMEWTHDSEGLLFIGTRNGESAIGQRYQLYYLAVDSGEARRLTTEGIWLQQSSLGVTNENAILIVPFNRSSQIWAMDAGGDAATATQITKGLADGRAGIAPLPDGRIGYWARSGDTAGVWTIDPDGSNAKLITPDSLKVEEVRSSPDGRYFYFSTLGYQVKFMRCDIDGANIVQVLNDDTFNVDTSISPDGRTFVYNSGSTVDGVSRHTLRLASSDGTDIRELPSIGAETPNFSPDGRYISFIKDFDTLAVISVPEGNLVASFKPEAVAFALNIGARWTPDGSSLAYVVKQKGACNIWVQPINGSKPRPLTNFTSGEIHNFAFSSDGKRLILARGYPIRDAVLIENFK